MLDPIEDYPTYGESIMAVGQTDVGFNMMLLDLDDLVVYRDGVLCTRVAVPTSATQYVLWAEGGLQGGSFHFGQPAVGGEVVTWERVTRIDRVEQLNENGPVGVSALNLQLHRFTVWAQEAANKVGRLVSRALNLPANVTNTPLPAYTPGSRVVFGIGTDGVPTLFDEDDFMGPPSTATIDAYNFLKTKLVEGAGVDFAFNDVTNTITVTMTASASYSTEQMQDDLNSTIAVANGITRAYDDALGTFTIGLNYASSTFVEAIQDIIAGLLAAAFPIVETYNDAGNIDTISLDQTGLKPPGFLVIPLCDYGVAPTTGIKYSFQLPYAITLSEVFATLATAQSSGSIFIADVLVAGVSIFTTNKLSIDNGETSGRTAATGENLTTTAIPADTPITFEITQVGTGGAGANVVMMYSRT